MAFSPTGPVLTPSKLEELVLGKLGASEGHSFGSGNAEAGSGVSKDALVEQLMEMIAAVDAGVQTGGPKEAGKPFGKGVGVK
jgi:hypothetical protein